MNKVILSGRLTREPQVKYSGASQLAVAKFSIAIDRLPKRGENAKSDFIQITVFGKTAENCEKYLTKGSMILVEGRIQSGSYEDKDGKNVYTTDVIADRVEFMEFREKKDQPAVEMPKDVIVNDDDLVDF